MSDWTLGGTRIFVQELSDAVKSILAKLQPLAGGTVPQSFGYETNQIKLSGLIVGEADKLHLKSLTTSGSVSFELMSPEGDLGDFFIEAVSTKRERTISQTIRQDLDCASPVFTVEIELLEDV
jgi:hypothetical protein